MENFKKLLEQQKQKVFYFFKQGEFMDTIEADSKKKAVSGFLETFKINDFDLLIEFNKKDDSYQVYRFENLKKCLRHQKKKSFGLSKHRN